MARGHRAIDAAGGNDILVKCPRPTRPADEPVDAFLFRFKPWKDAQARRRDRAGRAVVPVSPPTTYIDAQPGIGPQIPLTLVPT